MLRDAIVAVVCCLLVDELLGWAPYAAEAMVRRAARKHPERLPASQSRVVAAVLRFSDRRATMFVRAGLIAWSVRAAATRARLAPWGFDSAPMTPAELGRVAGVGAGFGLSFGSSLVLFAAAASGPSVLLSADAVGLLLGSAAIMGTFAGAVGFAMLVVSHARHGVQRAVLASCR